MNRTNYMPQTVATLLLLLVFASIPPADSRPMTTYKESDAFKEGLIPLDDLPFELPEVPEVPSCSDGTTHYTGASTTVARNNNATATDEGTLTCTNDNVVGGGFLPFGAGNTTQVIDDEFGRDVAFQVCIDNDGDLDCHAGPPNNPCEDEIFFSHSDDGSFNNPLGPLPESFKPGCPGGYNGYVIFICQGEHDDQQGTHTHAVTQGTISASGSIGTLVNGTFCGSPPPPPLPRHAGPGVKQYRYTN